MDNYRWDYLITSGIDNTKNSAVWRDGQLQMGLSQHISYSIDSKTVRIVLLGEMDNYRWDYLNTSGIDNTKNSVVRRDGQLQMGLSHHIRYRQH